MKTIKVNISSKYFQSFFTLVGGLFLVYAVFLSNQTKITSDHFYTLYDLQVEQYHGLGIKQSDTVITSQTVRDISDKFKSHNLHAVIGMSISGGCFLLLALFLNIFNVNISNREQSDV